MVHAGVGGLDTPRTNLGDATYLGNGKDFDFDISQEPSFQSPSKDNNNLVNQMQKGGRGAIRTPRSRTALTDRRNLPAGLGGGEFTPLLKNATRNSALRNGKENSIHTPGFLRGDGLDNIPELSVLPALNSSVYGGSRMGDSYMAATPGPQLDDSSNASTPMALLPRRNEGPGVLQDGNQLSLREQENVIDKIEKENFGLKLKIHFLEEALRKAGPGFSEAALKENTELKVDKVTMQKELLRYRKTLGAAERDVEVFRQQVSEMHDKMKQKHASEGQKEGLNRLRRALEVSEAEVDRLKLQAGEFEDLKDNIGDLEAEVREKTRVIEDREDEVENLKDEVEKHLESIATLKQSVKQEQRRNIELEEKIQANDELEEAKETIEELERDLRRVKDELDEVKEDRQEAVKERERAQNDLEELQEEMANKSITTKGLSRQVEEKANRLQDEIEVLRDKYDTLEEDYGEKETECEKLERKIKDLKEQSESREQELQNSLTLVKNETQNASKQQEILSQQLEATRSELQQKSEAKDLLQTRYDALTQESGGLQKELAKARESIEDLEDKLEHEKTVALNNEREVRDQYKDEINRLNDEIEDLRAKVREMERLYDNDSDKWDSEKRTLESQRDAAEDKADNLQRTIDKLQVTEGSLSSKESRLKEALEAEKDRHAIQESVLKRQIEELNDDIANRRKSLEEAKSELMSTREELRLSQREQKSLLEKVEGLEDEVEILQSSLDDDTQANDELIAAKHEAESLRRQIQTLKQDVSKAEALADSARAQLEAFQDDVEAGNGNNEKLISTIRDAQAQLAKVRQDKQGLQDELASLNLEMHTLRLSKAEAEAERDELYSQIKTSKQHDEETFRFDQERIDLRTSKIKLEAEVRRLKEENKAVVSQQDSLEVELQQEIDRANSEEARLSTEIHDLEKLLRGSSEKRELSTAKKTIQQLEKRIQELEEQVSSGKGGEEDATHELSLIRADLNKLRQRETEFLQREATQKETVRGLKCQIVELERKAYDAELSRLVTSSPPSSINGSARKSEIIEIRSQLASAHQSVKEMRSQLKSVEKESARKLTSANIELQAQARAWEAEKDELERSIDEAQLKIEELGAKNNTSEASIVLLRGKIDRLEKALQAERANSTGGRTMALERQDLHEMLRETQVQAESLELQVEEREKTIAAISAVEAELRLHLKRVRDERSQHKFKAAAAQANLESLERQLQESQQNWDIEKKSLTKSIKSGSAKKELEKLQRRFEEAQRMWDDEKAALTRGVRFVNTSVSTVNNHSDEDIEALKKEFAAKEHVHVKEMRGMALQVQWLKAQAARETAFRVQAAYAKRYMGLQIDMYQACNRADLRLLESTGVKIERKKKPKAFTLRIVAQFVRATIRMQKQADDWKKSTAIRDRLTAQARKEARERLALESKEARQKGEDVGGLESPPDSVHRRNAPALRHTLLHGGGVWQSNGKIA
ncbi:hypothetical protein HYALB_00001288 [Hymenoscyphus albidus]|uniref:Uncharacterized protein n=1 Tax=Hymenoscyphus albidus TaxID=595503 RepID=A0A9N9PRV0_9HELO|nr:hypothetical protein HYALB_00001288 [Hymenoscyphus albidus]